MHNWDVAFADFMTSLTGSRADNTVRYYRAQLVLLDQWATEENVDLKDFTAKHMRTYIALRSKTVSERTRRHDVTAARCFFKFCKAEGYINVNPISDYIVPKAPRAYIKMPSDTEIKAILHSLTARWQIKENPKIRCTASNTRSFFMRRNFAIVTGLIETAARAGEMLNLRLDDYQPDRLQIAIRTSKSKQPRIVPISSEWVKAVEGWLKIRPSKIESDLLFVNEFGDPITVTQLGKTFRKYLEVAEVEGITLHSLRHYSITQIAKKDVWAASQIAGHRDLNVTRAYLHGDPDHVRAMHSEASPLGRVMITKAAVAKRKKKII